MDHVRSIWVPTQRPWCKSLRGRYQLNGTDSGEAGCRGEWGEGSPGSLSYFQAGFESRGQTQAHDNGASRLRAFNMRFGCMDPAAFPNLESCCFCKEMSPPLESTTVDDINPALP